MLHVVLYQPQIPPNTGNIIRLMANTGFHLHLIEPLGFNFETKQLRRAGLDYSNLANVTRHASFTEFIERQSPQRIFAVTTRGQQCYSSIDFRANDALLFGSETSGLPEDIHQQIPGQHTLRIPMRVNNRSLNLSNSVAIVIYEAWRQWQFKGADC